jgi:ribosome-associated protein
LNHPGATVTSCAFTTIFDYLQHSLYLWYQQTLDYIIENFTLKEGEEYIELKNLIKLLGWVDTGGEAKIRIDNQEIKLNGEIETQRRKKIRRGDIVMFANNQAAVN